MGGEMTELMKLYEETTYLDDDPQALIQIIEYLKECIQGHKAKAEAYDRVMSGLNIDKSKIFYKNCTKNRKKGCKICDDCPFRAMIEQFEKEGMKELQDGKD